MSYSADILKLRVLLYFLKSDANDCTVTRIAKTLSTKKYAISRVLISLEKEGYVNRDNVRNPILTEKGYSLALYYSERLESSLNHLLFEGVDVENAKRDAFIWALYCSDKTMNVIRTTENRYKVKYELKEYKQFTGDVLCKKLKDGVYQLPFMICNESVHDGNNLSVFNDGFEHPCSLCIKNGIGTVKIRTKKFNAKSLDKHMCQESINNIKYFSVDKFISAEVNGSLISFPAEYLNFVNIGSGIGQILYGSTSLSIECTVNKQEDKAIFIILI